MAACRSTSSGRPAPLPPACGCPTRACRPIAAAAERAPALRVLVVGGYGTFGGRIVDLLAGQQGLELIVAGRSRDAARAFCALRRDTAARLRPETFDRDGDLAGILGHLAPALVLDASGPFQAYGERPWRLPEACIAAGVPCADLADAPAYVTGIAALDSAARARSTFVLSGLSTFPVLTAAIVRHLAVGLTRLQTVMAAVAPSPRAIVGSNVVRAIAAQAGQPLLQPAGWPPARAFRDHRRLVVDPPGGRPLPPRMASRVAVPDPVVLPPLWPGLKEVWIGAALAPGPVHRLLVALAGLVAAGLLPSLTFLAPVMERAMPWLRLGEHRGGVLVAVTGLTAEGRPVERSWHLTAEGDHGPWIPAMPAAALVLRLLGGCQPAPGARPAASEFELEDYRRWLDTAPFRWGIRERAAPVP